MRELLNLLTQNDFIQKERPLDTKDIIDVQKHFVRNELPFLPKMFIDFLKIYNGVKTEGGAVFGIFPDDQSLDILDTNARYNRTTNQVILGADDFAFLVYDDLQKKYLLLDRTDGLELDDFLETEFSSAIMSVLHF